MSPLHTLYVEAYGNPEGLPVLFLHGGPGSGLSEAHRDQFDPAKYHVILFDQRGCGQSTPHASIEANTTWDLVEDIETLRRHVGLEHWVVFGGSWGSTLALAYAQSYPDRVLALILRGIFLCRHDEIRWFYQSGCHWSNPHLWERFVAPIPVAERDDLLKAYYRRLTSDDAKVQLEAAKAWADWEGSSMKLYPDPDMRASFTEAKTALALARIECHYFNNNAFFTAETEILNPARLDRIRSIPTWLIHGRYDLVTPLKNAWDLHKALPEATLEIIPAAGHSFSEPGIYDALQRALNDYYEGSAYAAKAEA